ncbi:hypothetical protein TVAG_213900 [Trichomonas vaginalis G3]|uniref:F5/8 type C domain-containing protein n=1 Tax=Trichomonas vaginalis (strain ATCC PRA-98 / G3) TaxID=412133 RepID=A2G4Z1_TRIV3|nr:ankyrin repeat domain-containing protein 61 family [Trichomonas vaginalis G3]EAX87774.1 hypothetical protein TVAG_213900 [Trichomonas vaginalis G3]KAI5486967.1 ankyrin repeat domain-containing protein 61 family [Trichomonas vaginalis G3]|eukprot:XP_001300704.1 hypothetical protein [Trichomonas vaginalis G3]
MSRIKWEKAIWNISALPPSLSYPADIRINNRNYKTNSIFLWSISNKVKNLLYSERLSNKYTFNCNIKDQKTYDVLEELFHGQFINDNLTDSIHTDLFEFAITIESQDLIEFYYEKFKLSNFTIENFDNNIIYCKYCDPKDEFIIFISENISNIGVGKIVESCNSLGYDFAEKIILYCQKESIDFNDLISALIESNSLFFNLLLSIDLSKLYFDAKIRILKTYLETKNTNDSIAPIIISFLPTITCEHQEAKQEINQLKKETEITKQENDKLRKETEISKQENDKLRKETEISKQENDKLRKEIEELNSVITLNYSGNQYDGIFSYLRRINKGQNPLTCGAISVSISGNFDGNNSNLFEYSTRLHNWYLDEVANNSVSFDFKDRKVSLSAYTIKSGSCSYWDKPVDFAIEGSNNCIQWDMIDDKPNNREMGGDDMVHTWTCSPSPFYRYIRFRLKTKCSGGQLYTDHFEFFGKIK